MPVVENITANDIGVQTENFDAVDVSGEKSVKSVKVEAEHFTVYTVYFYSNYSYVSRKFTQVNENGKAFGKDRLNVSFENITPDAQEGNKRIYNAETIADTLKNPEGYVYNYITDEWGYKVSQFAISDWGFSYYRENSGNALWNDSSFKVYYRNSNMQVTFDSNGGSKSAPTSITVKAGERITLPEYTGKNGDKVFVGWSEIKNANANGNYKPGNNGTVYPAGSEYAVSTKDVTLYATWSDKNVDAYFYIRLDGQIPTEPQGHDGSEYTSAIQKAGAIKIATFYTDSTDGVENKLNSVPSANEIVEKLKSDHRNKNNLQVKFGDKTSYDFNTTASEFESNYYVLWYVIKSENVWHVDGVLLKKSLVNLTYNPNAPDGTWNNMPDGRQYVKDSTVIVSDKIPTRKGYVFTGWNTRADGRGTSYDGTDSAHNSFVIKANTTLYAQWRQKNDVMLYYVALEGGKVKVSSEAVAPVTGVPNGSTAEANTGYKFDGWYSDRSCTETSKVTSSKKFVPEKDENALWENGTTWYAKFVLDEIKTVKVNYVSENTDKGRVANAEDTIQIVTGKGLNGSTATAKPGYKFAGWYKGSEEVTKNAVLDKTTAEAHLNKDTDGNYAATTYTARFAPDETKTVKVNYVSESTTKGRVANAEDTIQIVTGKGLNGSTATAKPGYKFAGWYKGSEEVTKNAVLDKTTAEAHLNKDTDGNYAATTYTARFAPDETKTVKVNYVSESTTKGRVDNAEDSIQIVTGEGLNGSTAEAEPGYKFAGWYKGTEEVTKNAVLDKTTAEAHLNKDTDGNYTATTFIAKFIEREDLESEIRYYYDEVEAIEQRVINNNAVFNSKILTNNPLNEVDYNGKHYVLDDIVGKDNLVTVIKDNNIVKVYYALDELGTNPENPTNPNKPDGIADKYQIVFTYVADDHGTVTGMLKEVVTRYEGDKKFSTTAPAYPIAENIVATPDAGYKFVNWTSKNPSEASANIVAVFSRILQQSSATNAKFKDVAAIRAAGFTQDTEFTAHFVASDATTYNVEVYYEYEGKYSTVPSKTETLAGTTDTKATVAAETYLPTSGYVFDQNAGNVLEGTIAGDNSLVLKVYYKQVFKVTYAPGDHGSFKSQTYTVSYGDQTPEFSGDKTVNGNYRFTGWDKTIESRVTGDIVYTAQWAANSNGGGNGGGGGGSSSGGGGGSSSGPRDNGSTPSGGPGATTVTIDPDAVPLANLPNEDGAADLLVIDDEDVPLAALPKTGQSGTNGLVFFLSSMMLAAFVAVTKKREDDK